MNTAQQGCFSRHAGLLVLLLLLFSPVLNAQYRESPTKAVRLYNHVTDAAEDVFSWYDAPIYLVYLVNRYDFIPQDDKPIILQASAAEEELARSVAAPGGSPGSMDPFTIPHILLAGRLAWCTVTELTQDQADTRPALRHTLGMYKALIYTQVSTQMAKNLISRDRPDRSDNKSFFSGHTSTTFAVASYLQRELDASIMHSASLATQPLLRSLLRTAAFSVPYGWATYVGYSRMRDNRHYLVDVLVGAAIGTLIGNVIYNEVADDEQRLPVIGLAFAGDTPALSLQLQF
ncbi:phosphatase PAP2 family protein [bacterium]|nr:phosphatase PAP2 family protein [bacterium]